MKIKEPSREERTQARLAEKQRLAEIWAGHEKIQSLFGTEEGNQIYREAREWIGVCKLHQSCSGAFLSAWDAILDHPKTLLKMLKAGETDYLIQSSPFLATIITWQKQQKLTSNIQLKSTAKK